MKDANERELIFALADMVAQNCRERDGIYETGLIRCHKTAMELLTDLGVMVDAYPQRKDRECHMRHYYAKFVDGWEIKIRDGGAGE